jgi:UDP-N-acetylmuramoyl-L-alanyl-D-glutamate--2,6-diaminopimelate ligase
MIAPRKRDVSLAALLGPGLAGPLADITVSGLSLDSRQVARGDAFLALRGDRHDGHAYLADAARAGAAVALVERAVDDAPLAQLVVPRLRERVADLAAAFYGYPSRSLHLTAVTGTNGKTTVSQLFAQLVRACGYACGTVGTLGASLDSLPRSSTHTTPDAISLQRILAAWADEAVPFVGMEASSHALDQGRLDSLDIDVAVFTNLTRDHLDYHGDMEAYGAAKARLFRFPTLRAVVLNADDPFSSELAARAEAGVSALTYSAAGAKADVRASRIELSVAGLRFHLDSPWGAAVVRCPLIGAFNVANVLAALTAALEAGMPFEAVTQAAATLRPVPGRMEPLRSPGGPLVVVDYAHTPDALAKALGTLREQCAGRLVLVFGCGGDRDRGKRPLMAEAASRHADFSVVTSDNPRSEDPAAIIADVQTGMSGAYECRVDRREAIALALAAAGSGDCVLIAGKGHEATQQIGDRTLAFSDIDVARELLEGAPA